MRQGISSVAVDRPPVKAARYPLRLDLAADVRGPLAAAPGRTRPRSSSAERSDPDSSATSTPGHHGMRAARLAFAAWRARCYVPNSGMSIIFAVDADLL